MLSFSHLILADGVPIYQQILRYVKLGIAGGTIAHGEELPSRRVVSALLGGKPQKAYRLLEEEGLILSHTGAKSTVVADEAAQSRVRGELLQAEVRDTIAAMKHMGLSRQEALALVDQLWKEGETP